MTLNNAEEYDNPILYDQENALYMPETSFLLKWAAQKQGIILDLACGTGRMTIPLATHGYKLIGIDIHQGMLEEARKKSAKVLHSELFGPEDIPRGNRD